MAYREPANDDELDARLDDELSALDRDDAAHPGDWRTERDRRRSWMRAVFPSASIGCGIGMIFGHSAFEIVLGILAGVAAGFLISFMVRLVDKNEHAADHIDHDDDEH